MRRSPQNRSPWACLISSRVQRSQRRRRSRENRPCDLPPRPWRYPPDHRRLHLPRTGVTIGVLRGKHCYGFPQWRWKAQAELWLFAIFFCAVSSHGLWWAWPQRQTGFFFFLFCSKNCVPSLLLLFLLYKESTGRTHGNFTKPDDTFTVHGFNLAAALIC